MGHARSGRPHERFDHPTDSVVDASEHADASAAGASLTRVGFTPESPGRLLGTAERLAKFGTWEYDVETDALAWSDGLLDVWGLTHDIPHSLANTLALVHPDDFEAVSRSMSQAASEGLGFEVTFRITHGVTGETRWLDARGATLLQSGRVTKIYGATQDVTESVTHRHMLEAAQRRARNAERLAKTGAWDVDATGEGHGSDGFYHVLGLDPANPALDGFWDLVHGEDRARVKAEITGAVADGRSFEVEYRIHKPDGEMAWIRSSAEPDFKGSSTHPSYQGAVQDITAAKTAEHKIMEGHRAEEEFIDALTAYTAKLTPEGIVMRAGKAAIHAFGFEGRNHVGAQWLDGPWWTYDDAVHERVLQQFSRAIGGEQVRFTEIVRVGDVTRSLDVTLTPVFGGGGALNYIVAEGIDVTPQQRLQAALTAESQRLRRANADLEGFNHTVSHDLKAPLRGVTMFACALEEDHAQELSPDAQALLTRLRNEASRMDVIIADLLSLARGGYHQIDRSEVNLTAIAEDLAAVLTQREPTRIVEFDVAPDMRAHADVGLVRIALENLMGNAWKFTRSRQATKIEVGVTSSASGAEFFVRDNGIGFDASRASELFEPFKRLHAAEGYEGTGVGLSTVRRIVEGHGGRIWAENRAEGGALFRFTLEPSTSG